jgi:5-methyltetrahydrofolate--homocysteine methyltransferase
MREALDTRPRGDRPTLEQIVDILGPFTSTNDGTEDGANTGSERRSRRGRRRG